MGREFQQKFRGFSGRTALVALALMLAPGFAAAQLSPGEPADQLVLTDWATGASSVTDIEFVSDGRAVITTKTGEVLVASPDGTMLKRNAATFSVDTESEKGLLAVVRDASDNLYFYASMAMSDDKNKHHVFKGRLNADNTVTVDLTKPVVTGGLEGPANHDGGGLAIWKGHLYVGVGDTGQNATPPRNMYGACLNKANAKILRVNLDGTVPTDNPLVGMPMVTACDEAVGGMYKMAAPEPRIYAWGFRNPWRFWIDPETDLLWIGDVGEGTEEEISVGGKGANHGWPFNEGKEKFTAPLGGLSDCKMMTPATDCIAPQDSYRHEQNRKGSVTGGMAPAKGCGWGAFESRYFFADYVRNEVYTLDLAPDRKTAVPGSRKVVAAAPKVVSFKPGREGAIYLALHEQGRIKKLAPKTPVPNCLAAQAPGTGGMGGGTGGMSGAGGTPPGTGGVPGAGGGAGGGPNGAAAVDGRGSDTAGAPGSSPSDGCGCTLGAAPTSRSAATASLLALAALALIRRRRRR